LWWFLLPAVGLKLLRRGTLFSQLRGMRGLELLLCSTLRSKIPPHPLGAHHRNLTDPTTHRQNSRRSAD
jgi:hypothetical protein